MGIDRGWTGDDVAQLEPAEIRIDGDTARIGLRKGDSVLKNLGPEIWQPLRPPASGKP